jgi:hypothetical protein
LQFSSLGGTFGNTAGLYGSHTGTSTLGIGIANNSAGILTQVAAFTSTGLSITSGTITASAPALDLAQTWNNSGVTFTGLRFNATNTASASDSRLADFQIGGSSVTSIRRDGAVRFHGSGNITALVGNGCSLATAGGGTVWYTPQAFWTESSYAIIAPSGTPAIVLERDADSVLALRNGTKAHELRVYNTFTSTTNHERGFFKWSSNVLQIGTEKGSAGGTARALEFQTDGVTRMTIGTTGNVGINTSSPSQRLEVRGDALISSSAAWANGQTARLYFGDTGHSLQVPFTGNATWSNYNGIVFSNAAGTPFAMGTSASIGGSTTIALGGAITNFSTFAGASVVVSSTVATLKDTLDIAVGTTTGTKIGTATTQKIGFFNATPVVQQAAVADATDAATVITQLNALLGRMRTLGLIAT